MKPHLKTGSHTPGPWMWSDNRLGPVNPDLAASNVHSILDAEGGYGGHFRAVQGFKYTGAPQ